MGHASRKTLLCLDRVALQFFYREVYFHIVFLKCLSRELLTCLFRSILISQKYSNGLTKSIHVGAN